VSERSETASITELRSEENVSTKCINSTPARILMEIRLERVNAEKAREKDSMKNNRERNISDVDRDINNKEDRIDIV